MGGSRWVCWVSVEGGSARGGDFWVGFASERSGKSKSQGPSKGCLLVVLMHLKA